MMPKGQMNISNGQIILKQTGFNLIGAPVVMDATYGSISPQKAFFDTISMLKSLISNGLTAK
jgi:hypothetical protein